MKAWLSILICLQVIAAFAQPADAAAIRFRTVDIFVDAGQAPLAAYELEFNSKTANVKIVGIEGGEHPAFKAAPYYDPKAMQQERVIIAAFSTDTDLPRGRTRVATIHIQVTGSVAPDYEVKLRVGADAAGKNIPARATFEERKPQ